MITHRSSNVFVGWQTLTLNDGMSLPPVMSPPLSFTMNIFQFLRHRASLRELWFAPTSLAHSPGPHSLLHSFYLCHDMLIHYHRKMMLNSPKDHNTTKEPGCFECGTILIRSILLCGCTVSLQSIWIGNRVCELRCGFIIRGILRPLCMAEEVFLYRPF